MNQALTRTQLKKEAVVQSRLFDNLKGWLRAALHISTLSLVLALFGNNIHPALQIAGGVCLGLSIVAALIFGYALKRGKDNLNNIFQLLENTKG